MIEQNEQDNRSPVDKRKSLINLRTVKRLVIHTRCWPGRIR
jgi:hypothetical protein